MLSPVHASQRLLALGCLHSLLSGAGIHQLLPLLAAADDGGGRLLDVRGHAGLLADADVVALVVVRTVAAAAHDVAVVRRFPDAAAAAVVGLGDADGGLRYGVDGRAD